ncbi:uncharacterized protein LOC133722905 [Rosa rugosa]|uniref:uncharacterized protein LOC133722905 n=1 Tax=Rosa rugosa TaxID=74645 RepID=UPI002B416AB7|nr:uncharacterized protein LOC133722905 [Rosa rugosa]
MAEKNKSKVVCSYDDHSDAEESKNTLDDLTLPLEKLNLGPEKKMKKLLVIGLGGLLCHRVYRTEKIYIPNYRHPDAAYGNYKVKNLSFVWRDLKWEYGLLQGRKWYLDNALDCVMKGLRRKLLFAWDQVECTDSGFKTLENQKKPIFLKELKKIWENKGFKASLPSSMGKYSSLNTLLIDDKAYKALLNPAHTAIFPPEYKVDQVDDKALGLNGELRLYLEGLADADDVTSYVKDHPFGQPAITTTHSDWDFYSKILTHFQKD